MFLFKFNFDYKFKKYLFSISIYFKRVLLKLIKRLLFFDNVGENYQPDTIIVLKIGGLGDFLFGVPALNLIRESYPHARICLITARDLSVLKFQSLDCDLTDTKKLPWLKLVGAAVNEILIINDLSIKTIKELSCKIPKGKKQTIFILGYPGMTISSAVKKLILVRMMVKGFVTCVGVDKKFDDKFMRKFQSQYNYRHKTLGDIDSVLESLPNYKFQEKDLNFDVFINPTAKISAIQKIGLRNNNPFILIAPVATRIHKQWPLENFVRLTEELKKSRVDCEIILIGTKENYAEVKKAYENIDFRVNNLCGILSIEELASLFTVAKGYIGNDGGMSQLAGTIGCSSVVVFNSIEADWITHPWRSREGVIRSHTSCSPCFNAIYCPEGHRKCMVDISVESVLLKANKVIFKTEFQVLQGYKTTPTH
jgi:heptosyltransferase-2